MNIIEAKRVNHIRKKDWITTVSNVICYQNREKAHYQNYPRPVDICFQPLSPSLSRKDSQIAFKSDLNHQHKKMTLVFSDQSAIFINLLFPILRPIFQGKLLGCVYYARVLCHFLAKPFCLLQVCILCRRLRGPWGRVARLTRW